ncbi:MAG: hypothetical protein ACE5EJ_04950 [Nitrosopumilaceae archaeon]
MDLGIGDMDFGQIPKIGIDEITGENIPTRRYVRCQNKLCGVRNTTIGGKYCSIMCADCDAGVLSEKEWVEIHFEFWSNSTFPQEKSGV